MMSLCQSGYANTPSKRVLIIPSIATSIRIIAISG